MSQKAKVFTFDVFTGNLEEHDDGKFTFTYDTNYLKSKNARPISLTMPIREQSYESTSLFPFFDGLIPEGWMLNLAIKNWKLNPRDRMGLLLNTCRDCIGSVHVEPVGNSNSEDA